MSSPSSKWRVTLYIPGESEPRIWETDNEPLLSSMSGSPIFTYWIDPVTNKKVTITGSAIVIEQL